MIKMRLLFQMVEVLPKYTGKCTRLDLHMDQGVFLLPRAATFCNTPQGGSYKFIELHFICMHRSTSSYRSDRVGLAQSVACPPLAR